MKTGLQTLGADLLEVARLGNALGRELGRAIHPELEVSHDELRAIQVRARAARARLLEESPDGR